MANKQKLNHNRQAMALKNFRFTRYLMLRYVIALCFFVNLYWLVFLWGQGIAFVVPGALLCLATLACFEQVKLYDSSAKQLEGELKFNRRYYLTQMLVNASLIISALTGIMYQTFFPFLLTLINVRLLLSGFLLLGICLSGFSLNRIKAICENKDKFYERIVAFESANQKIRKK